jgi:hypothetical protein
MRKPEYREGIEAKDNLERGMKAQFQVPKVASKKEEAAG